MAAENNARTYTNEWSDLTGAALGAGIARTEMKDFDATGYSVSNEPITVPASADSDGFYRVALTQQPRQGTLVVTRTSGSVVLTQVAISATPGANEVGVDWQKGALKFPASAAGVAHTATYTGNGSIPLGFRWNQLQKDVDVLNEAADGFAVQANFLSRNPRVLHVSTAGNNTTGDGSIAAPYATIKKAHDIIKVATTGTPFIVVLSPGTHAMDAADYSFNIVFANPVLLVGDGKATVDITAASSDSLFFSGGLSARGVRFEIGANITALEIDNTAAANFLDGCTFLFKGTGTVFTVGATSRFLIRDCAFDESGTAGVSLAGTNAVSVVGCTFRSDAAVTINGLSSGDFAEFSGNTVTAGTVADITIHCPIVKGNKITGATGGEIDFRGGSVFSGNYVFISGGTDTFYIGNGSSITTTVQGNFISAPYFVITAKHVEGNTLLATSTTIGQGGGGLIALSPPSGGTASVIGNVIRSSIPFQEDPPNATNGLVMAIGRFSGTGLAVIEGNVYTGKSIFLMNSHPSQDGARDSEDRDLVLRNNYMLMDKGATDGPDDVNAVFISYGRGSIISEGNVYRALLAASTKTDAHHACLFLHPQTSAGTQVFTSVNDRFEVTLPAGTVTVTGTSTDEKCCIAVFDGSEDRVTATFINPSISVDGNEEHVFAGLGSPKVVVAGVVSCNAALTYQGTAPAGSYQYIRGDLAISGALSVGGNATVTGNLQVDGNATLGNASGDSLTINAGAPTAPNLSTGTDAYFLTLDGSNVIRKEAVGVGTTASSVQINIYDEVLVGTHEMTFINGLLTTYNFAP